MTMSGHPSNKKRVQIDARCLPDSNKNSWKTKDGYISLCNVPTVVVISHYSQ